MVCVIDSLNQMSNMKLKYILLLTGRDIDNKAFEDD